MKSKFYMRFEKRFSSAQFSFRQICDMFFTLVLDQFFMLFIGMLASAMVSSTGEAAIAAVNMVGSVNALVVLVFTAVATSGSIVVARAKGEGNVESVRCAIGETVGISGFLALVLSTLLFAFSSPLVRMLYPRAEALLIGYSIHYMRLMSISFIPFSLFAAVFYALRSVGDTRSSLMLTIVINGVHLIFSFLFINVMHLGVTGAGLAYIAARVIGASLALLWLLRIHNQFGLRVSHLLHFTRRISGEIFRLGIPIASESALIQGGMLLVQIYLAYLTTTEMAAHGVANSMLTLFQSTSTALTALCSTVCGQCFGAGLYNLTDTYCRQIIRTGRVVLLLTSIVLLPISPLILKLFHPSAQAQPIIYQCLFIAAVGLPLLWCDGHVTPMALRVAGDILWPTIVSVCALFIGRIAVGYYLTIVVGLGVPGVWLGMMVEWMLRALLFRYRLRSRKWLPAGERNRQPQNI